MLASVEYKLRSELQLSLGELGGKNTGDGEADDRIKDISRRILRPSRECDNSIPLYRSYNVEFVRDLSRRPPLTDKRYETWNIFLMAIHATWRREPMHNVRDTCKFCFIKFRTCTHHRVVDLE